MSADTAPTTAEVLGVTLEFTDVDTFAERFASFVEPARVLLPGVAPRPPGTLIRFQLRLRDERPVLGGEGRVEAVIAQGEIPGCPPGLLLRFEPDEDSRPLHERILGRRGDGRSPVLPPPPPESAVSQSTATAAASSLPSVGAEPVPPGSSEAAKPPTPRKPPTPPALPKSPKAPGSPESIGSREEPNPVGVAPGDAPRWPEPAAEAPRREPRKSFTLPPIGSTHTTPFGSRIRAPAGPSRAEDAHQPAAASERLAPGGEKPAAPTTSAHGAQPPAGTATTRPGLGLGGFGPPRPPLGGLPPLRSPFRSPARSWTPASPLPPLSGGNANEPATPTVAGTPPATETPPTPPTNEPPAEAARDAAPVNPPSTSTPSASRAAPLLGRLGRPPLGSRGAPLRPGGTPLGALKLTHRSRLAASKPAAPADEKAAAPVEPGPAPPSASAETPAREPAATAAAFHPEKAAAREPGAPDGAVSESGTTDAAESGTTDAAKSGTTDAAAVSGATDAAAVSGTTDAAAVSGTTDAAVSGTTDAAAPDSGPPDAAAPESGTSSAAAPASGTRDAAAPIAPLASGDTLPFRGRMSRVSPASGASKAPSPSGVAGSRMPPRLPVPPTGSELAGGRSRLAGGTPPFARKVRGLRGPTLPLGLGLSKPAASQRTGEAAAPGQRTEPDSGPPAPLANAPAPADEPAATIEVTVGKPAAGIEIPGGLHAKPAPEPTRPRPSPVSEPALPGVPSGARPDGLPASGRSRVEPRVEEPSLFAAALASVTGKSTPSPPAPPPTADERVTPPDSVSPTGVVAAPRDEPLPSDPGDDVPTLPQVPAMGFAATDPVVEPRPAPPRPGEVAPAEAGVTPAASTAAARSAAEPAARSSPAAISGPQPRLGERPLRAPGVGPTPARIWLVSVVVLSLAAAVGILLGTYLP